VLAEPSGSHLKFTATQDSDNRLTDSASQRIASERRTVLARLQDAEHVTIGDNGGQRDHAAAESLSE
jgi:hypothetical protein